MLGALALLLALLALAGILKLVSVFLKRPEPEEQTPYIVFESADYDADITQDEAYMQQDRRVWVSVGAFFERYFNALKMGDAAALRACYTDECARVLKLPGRITQQRVYDILLTLVSTAERSDDAGVKYTESVYRFEYKIMKNDGTFRGDLESGAVRAQLVTLSEYPGEVKISDVIGKYIVQGGKS